MPTYQFQCVPKLKIMSIGRWDVISDPNEPSLLQSQTIGHNQVSESENPPPLPSHSPAPVKINKIEKKLFAELLVFIKFCDIETHSRQKWSRFLGQFFIGIN